VAVFRIMIWSNKPKRHAVSVPVPLQTRSILRDSETCHTPSLHRVKACWQVVVKTKAQKKI